MRITFKDEHCLFEDTKNLYSSRKYKSQVHNVFKKYTFKEYSVEFYRGITNKIIHIFIYNKDEIIGIVEAKKERDYIEMYSASILPEHQRKGIYTSVISYLRKFDVCRSDSLQTEKTENAWIKLGAKKIGSHYYLNRV